MPPPQKKKLYRKVSKPKMEVINGEIVVKAQKDDVTKVNCRLQTKNR